VSAAKTAEPIEMPFGGWTGLGWAQRTMYIAGDPDPARGQGHFHGVILGRSQIYPVQLKHAGTADAWTPVIIEAPVIDAGTAVDAARRSRTLDNQRGGTRPWPADQREAQNLWIVTSSECYI